MPAILRRRVIVRGRVQGVFFRASTQKKALNAEAKGWVRNLPDGNVEAAFEGREEAVEAMVEYCHRGPIASRVDEVEVFEETPEGLQDFEIRR